ncbi:MAG: asparaginase [Bacteroidota bacterium]|nr:asparaginase [Candidatus Kapabacteria bacterium]MDW8220392.1 asparaginase [Bacteroidota bacterium]
MSSSVKPRVALVFTGGTISMKLDNTFGGIVPALSADEILSRSPSIHTMCNLECIEFGRYPGPHMNPERMVELSRCVQELAEQPSIHGIVVTHGTDTLEETAYFLDCTVNTPKPIVVVGSMRNSSEPDWDGPRNLRDAILLVLHPKARGMGVMVCLADTIQAASEVSKMDTSNLNTFESTNFGPLGRIVNGSVMLYRQPVRRDYFLVKELPRFVPIIKCYASSEAELMRLILDHSMHQPEGIVVEGMGVGNVPPPVYHQILRALERGIPVVLTSRCPIGRVEHLYAYEGAGKQLYEAGVIFADYLSGQKARIKLIAALGAGYTIEQLRSIFEWA